MAASLDPCATRLNRCAHSPAPALRRAPPCARAARRSRSTMVAELMSDNTVRAYAKRKFLDVQRETQRGGKKARKEAKKGLAPKWSKARH